MEIIGKMERIEKNWKELEEKWKELKKMERIGKKCTELYRVASIFNIVFN